MDTEAILETLRALGAEERQARLLALDALLEAHEQSSTGRSMAEHQARVLELLVERDTLRALLHAEAEEGRAP